jgi:uncharacterized protein YbbC (DUF1343 family)
VFPIEFASSFVFIAAFISILYGMFALRTVSAGHGSSRNSATSGVDSVRVRTGIDVLEEQGFAPLRGKSIGLITNQTGVDSHGRRTIDVLAAAPDLKLVALFSPEHGIEGILDEAVPSGKDPSTGLPIFSLYGQTRRPTAEMLRGIDALVFDIQDAGVRFYTFTTTMAYAMEEAAKHHLAFYVLDRPNPLGGDVIEGPMLDADRLSFTGYFPMPVRYGMTIGELARMFNAENKIGADLHVIGMKNWRRGELFAATGLNWIPPSPNLRTLSETLLYPGIEILQAGGVSVGRGTPTPFELAGAPWIRAEELTNELNGLGIPGVDFSPIRFVPTDAIYQHQACEGVSIRVSNVETLNPMLMGLDIASALWKLYPDEFAIDKMIDLVGSADTIERLKKGESPTEILKQQAGKKDAFRRMRAKYLIYR